MKKIHATAPGKIVLAGEYAVLYGAHAIVAAVDRLARVSIEPTDSSQIEIRAPGYSQHVARYALTEDKRLEAQAGRLMAENFSLFEQAWRACAPREVRGAIITLDTSAFMDHENDSKLGLGSSAALCVALTAALKTGCERKDIARIAGKIHFDLQGGGSGADIACAVHGGVIDYCKDNDLPAAVAMPAGLYFAVLWSGKPASTATHIKALTTSLQGNGQRATLHKLCAAADALAESWQENSATKIYAEYVRFGKALVAFDADHRLGVYAAGHAELAAAAEACGLFYKPCGAGGGDVGVAVGLERRKLRSFAAQASDFGFRVLDLDLGAGGVHCARENHDG